MSQNNKRILGYVLLSIGFIMNVISIGFLLVPFITKQNNQLSFVGIGIFLIGALIMISGLMLIINTNNN